MNCIHCGFENAAGLRYCGNCGTKFGQRCPKCGSDNNTAKGTSLLCVQCGMRLEDASPPLKLDRPAPPLPIVAPDSERRHVTVVFCDLVGSTALSQRLDPEELRDVILSYRTVCAECTRRFGGYVARYVGDGLLIYFGYPHAHDDDAVMAVRAALEIIAAIKRLQFGALLEDGLQLRVHLGLHTGLVVVGDLGSGDMSVPAEIIGDTPNLAARIEERAEPDTVLISKATYLLVKDHFNCQPVDDFAIKGVSQPMAAFQVLSERDGRSPLYVLKSRDVTPLIGRNHELGLLVEQWHQAREGRGQGTTISGEPGIGKSRLVRALREKLPNEPHMLVDCYCSPRSSNSAFLPIIDFLERHLGIDVDDAPSERLEKLEKMLEACGLPLQEALPFLALLMSLPLSPRYVSPELSASGQREKTMEWLVAWLTAQARNQPLLVTVEDLHWADASTLDLLILLINQLSAARVFLLLTFRPEFRPPWGVHSHLRHINLTRLSSGQVATMLNSLANGRALPPAVYKEVLEKTDGVPLFIEEVAKMVMEAGVLTFEKDRYELSKPGHRLAIPATLRDSLTARLDRTGQAKVTAQLAATLGRDFSYELLQAVSPLDAPDLDRDLSILVEADLLRPRGQPPRVMYRFKHSLIQDAAYDSLLRVRRRHYHRQIGNTLVERFPEIAEIRPEFVADHYTSAGAALEAIRYWRIAGQRALERSANVEAAAHLTQALELITRLPASVQRDEEEATLQISLGAAVAATKGYGASEVQDAYDRAWTLCQRLAGTPQVYSALRGLEAFYQVRGPLSTARAIGEQLLQMAEQSHNNSLLAEAKRPLGWCMFCLGETTDANRILVAALDLYDPAESDLSTLTFGIDTRVMGLANLAWAKCYLGHPADALRCSHEAIRLAREVFHPQSLAYALCMGAAVGQGLRDAHAAQELAKQAITLAKKNGFSYWVAWATILQGWAIAEGGRVAAGMATLRAGLTAYRATGAELFRPYSLALLAETCGKAGLPSEGLDLVAAALESSQQSEARFYDAELYRLKGDLLSMSGAAEEMIAPCYARAIELASAQGSRLLELRAAISLNRLRGMGESGVEARRQLVEVLATFTDGFDFDDLVQARDIVNWR
jgi:TOMM system kinase/cyclase fusion protein